ncbi:MAG: hypothetical protein K0S53_206, partial [Bacteroidetes bacterium]|nr:hypothetical protein [Bacteroidota bacterium]
MYRFTNIVILVLAVIQNMIGQQTVDNEKAHRRYWYYRTRMINDFMKVGKEQGACIVFAQRNNGEDGSAPREFQSKVGPDQIDITNMYIMALALEYKLLSRNNQDTRETVKELYHMLYAINRLDLEAEQFFTVGMMPSSENVQQNGQLNGFMLREDMPKSFFTQNKTHFNYGLLERPIENNDPDENYSGYTGLQHTNDLSDDNKFSGFFPYQNESLEDLTLVVDKYMSMLTAMMFVSKYIPVGEHYGSESFQDGEQSIRQEAVNIANRCYGYLRNKNSSWNLHYQDNNGVYLSQLTAGNQAFLYSFPLSRMVCWTNKIFPWNSSSPFVCANYSDVETATVGRAAYNGFTMGTTTCSEDNSVFKAWCQAGSNLPALSNIGTLAPIYIGMSSNTTYNSIEWADLLRKVLHQDGALLKQLSVYGDPINEAPCQGPYNYGSCSHGGWEWSSQDRLEHPTARGFNCNGSPHSVPCVLHTQNSGFQGNYPGVDYMLLHNLYYEYQNQVKEGNQGNVGPSSVGNAITAIYNAVNGVPNLVSAAYCAVINQLTGSTICDATIGSSGNGGAGSMNANLVGYKSYNYMDNRDQNIWPRKVFENGPLSSGPAYLPGSPMDNVVQGTNDMLAKVAVFQNLSSIAHIYHTSSPAAPNNQTPSNVTYRAGKEIVLEPGFTVDHGSTFRAFIQRYVCTGNSDPLTMRRGHDSTAIEMESVDYENDQMNPIPIHYIESPKSDADNHPTVAEASYDENYLTEILPLDSPKSSEFKVTPNPTTGRIKVETRKTTEDE